MAVSSLYCQLVSSVSDRSSPRLHFICLLIDDIFTLCNRQVVAAGDKIEGCTVVGLVLETLY